MDAHPAEATGWRTQDIVVTAVIAVAFGVIFWAWNVVFFALAPLLGGPASPPAYLVSGMWLTPAVLAPLVVRRPGAALFAEVVAAAVSMALGGAWGLDLLLSGVMQGGGAELAFAIGRYRSYGLAMALFAAAGAALGEWVHDMLLYYPTVGLGVQLAFGVFMLVSALAIAGLGSWLLVRALAETGVLAGFPSGRSQRRV
jgi:energy-coupling factor transport system permease protein